MNATFAAALPLLKCALDYVNPWYVVVMRMVCAGIVLLGFGLWNGHPARLDDVRLLAWTGFVVLYCVCVGEVVALAAMPATVATLLWAQLPLYTAWVMRMVHREMLTWRQWCAVSCATASVVVLALSEYVREGVGSCPVWSVVVMMGAVYAAAYGYVLLERLMKRGHSIVMSNGIMMLGVGALAAATAWVVDGWRVLVPEHWAPASLYIGLVIVLVNFCGLYIQSMLLREQHSPTMLAVSSVLTPLMGIMYGVFVLGDQWHGVYGFVVMGIVGSLVLWGTYDPPVAHEPFSV